MSSEQPPQIKNDGNTESSEILRGAAAHQDDLENKITLEERGESEKISEMITGIRQVMRDFGLSIWDLDTPDKTAFLLDMLVKNKTLNVRDPEYQATEDRLRKSIDLIKDSERGSQQARLRRPQ